MKYSWQHPLWPQFSYDTAAVQPLLYQYAQHAGKLAGGLQQLNQSLQSEAYLDLMISEAIHTSDIEGERLNREDVRSSIKNYLGFNSPTVRVADSRAEGMAALMLDVRKKFAQPMTAELLCYWHTLVLPAELSQNKALARGQWRTGTQPMQIVSGPIGYEKVHYQAPSAEQVPAHMQQFLAWYQASDPCSDTQSIFLAGPVRAALAHFWFESIHPFEDGNGRVGRALAEHALGQDLKHPALLSLSTYLDQHRAEYYQQLHDASCLDPDFHASLDLSAWVLWFCQAVLSAQQDASASIEFVLKKAKFWEAQTHKTLNERQHKVLHKLFAAGTEGFTQGINAQKYRAITGCSKATASRDLADLVQQDCLTPRASTGRNARYELKLG